MVVFPKSHTYYIQHIWLCFWALAWVRWLQLHSLPLVYIFHCSYSRSFNNTQTFIILTVHSRKPWWNIIGSMAVFWWICLGPGADDRVTNTLFQILFGFTGRMIRSVISVPEQTFGFREERSEPIMLVSIPEVLGTGHRLSWPVSCLYSFCCGCPGLEGLIPSFCSAAERRWPHLKVKPSML